MSNKRLYSIGAVALIPVLLILDLNLALVHQSIDRRFTESDRRLDNPDRGFYIQVQTKNPEKIREAAEDVRLILLAFDIEDCAGRETIPRERLEELRRALRAAEEAGVSVIFRAAYGFRHGVEEPEELVSMGRHIRAISAVLNDFGERILVVQAGMLGAYGEWHSSRFLAGSEEECRESRLYVLRRWEEYLDPGIKLAVRRPRFIREAQKAGVLTGRLGLHNDALLSNESDMGTYDDPALDREGELKWVRANLADQCNGGEMPTPGALNAPKNADREFSLLGLSYLNLKYNREILEKWSRQTLGGANARSFLENRLGYRLFISEIHMDAYQFQRLLSDSEISMCLTLTNSGYGRLPEKYKVFLTAYNGEERIVRELSLPELSRISNGQGAASQLTWKLPREFIKDREEIRLGLKIAPEEGADTRECVELANSGFTREDGIYEIAVLRHAFLTWLEASV